jgi:hypothetical protein
MANQITPLDPKQSTLQVRAGLAQILGETGPTSLQIEKVSAHPGKNSRRIAFNVRVRRKGADEPEKLPVVLRFSSRDVRQLAKLFAQAADEADRIG